MSSGKILILKLYIESSDYIYNYTGKLSKTIVLSELPELEEFFRPSKGYYKLIRISPPIASGKAIVPVYEYAGNGGKHGFVLKPVVLRGDYVIEIGATNNVIETLYRVFKQSLLLKTRLKFENTIVTYIVRDVSVSEPSIAVNDSFVVSTVSPVLLPNPLIHTQHVRRFTACPGVFLHVPYMVSQGCLSHDVHVARRGVLELETCLAEHYSTRIKTVFINYDNNREPAVTGKIKYILTTRSEDEKNKCREILQKTLYVARVYGTGSSRANGFGTIEIKTPQKVKTTL